MQVKVLDQQSNKSVLKYTSGMKLNAKVWEDPERISDDRYYIILSSEDFNNTFSPFRLYKVQLRSCQANVFENSDSVSQLYQNQAVYSEWSTVCLIKGITKPILKIKYFTNDATLIQNNEEIGVLFKSNTVIVNGGLVFNEEETSQVLKIPEDIKSYKVTFYDEAKTLLEDSGILYPPSSNLRAIDYKSKTEFEPKRFYSMNIEITTTSFYTFVETFNFSVAEKAFDDLLIGYVEEDRDNGLVKIHIGPNSEYDSSRFEDEMLVYIRRTDSKSNFKVWEDVYSVIFDPESPEQNVYTLDWEDNTVEAGVWYKYGIEYLSSETGGIRSNIFILDCENNIDSSDSVMDQNESNNTEIKSQIMVTMEDVFLVGKDGQQLRISYDNTLDSMKYTQYVSKIDTIGSKYPFIRQNSETCYRVFTIGGLISFLSNEENFLFLKDSDLFGNESICDLYLDYNDKNNVTLYNDYTKERLFREKVMEFLIKDDVKLYRSTTEGNVLVKLMDVNFTPKQELGRYIYSFSATAVECGDCSIENYAKYNIQKRSELGSELISNLRTPLYKISSEDIMVNGLIQKNMSVTGNLKDILMTIYEAEWNTVQVGYKKNADGTIEEESDLDLATILAEYNLEDIRPYKIHFDFLDVPVDVGGISGYNFTIKTEEEGSRTYVVSKDLGNYTIESDEAWDFTSLTFPYAEEQNKPATLNVIIDAQLVFKRMMYKKKDGGWEPIIEGDIDPSATTGNIIDYAKQQFQITNAVVDGVWTDKDFVTIALDAETSAAELRNESVTSFSIYSMEAKDFPKGTIFKLLYNKNRLNYAIVQTTGTVKINLDTDTSDEYTLFNEIKIIGQLIAEDSFLVNEKYIISENNPYIQQGNEGWEWVENEEAYPIKFYEDLSFSQETQTKAKYGIIYNYFDNGSGSIPNIELYEKIGLQKEE